MLEAPRRAPRFARAHPRWCSTLALTFTSLGSAQLARAGGCKVEAVFVITTMSRCPCLMLLVFTNTTTTATARPTAPSQPVPLSFLLNLAQCVSLHLCMSCFCVFLHRGLLGIITNTSIITANRMEKNMQNHMETTNYLPRVQKLGEISCYL